MKSQVKKKNAMKRKKATVKTYMNLTNLSQKPPKKIKKAKKGTKK